MKKPFAHLAIPDPRPKLWEDGMWHDEWRTGKGMSYFARQLKGSSINLGTLMRNPGDDVEFFVDATNTPGHTKVILKFYVLSAATNARVQPWLDGIVLGTPAEASGLQGVNTQ